MSLDSIARTGAPSAVQSDYDNCLTDKDTQSIETHGKVASLLGRSLTEVKNDSQVEMAFIPMPESLKNLSSLPPKDVIEGLKKYMEDNQLSSITFVGIDNKGYLSSVNTVHHNENEKELLYQQSTLCANSAKRDEDMGYLDNAHINKVFCSAIFSGCYSLHNEEEQSPQPLSASGNGYVIYVR
ncbi:hypothetical protein [Serratia quinivorans]|uniref:hypothetical protein n=1 Tax=Serratia quinivorans TaxID=137545 RepID=UPI0021794BA1|nr:hypothetical protein [Serratia quinivorans]CAI1195961.1 Uncharacterised protein [Serratia quinivorans]